MKNFFKYVLATIVGIFGFIMIISIAMFLFVGVSAMFSSDGKKPLHNNSILQLNFDKSIMENVNESEDVNIFSLPTEQNVYYRDMLRLIDQAAEDDKIEGISMNLFSIRAGASQVAEIRKKIEAFKKSGKFVYAYGNIMSQNAYYMATVADSIFLNPVGNIELKGIASEVMFYKNMGEKYGMDFQVIRHGKYKSAVEPFIRDNLSDENREQLTELLTDVWGNLAKDMASSRQMSLEQLNTLTDSLVSFIPQNALESKLVDVLAQESEYYDFLQAKMGVEEKEDLDFISLADYAPHYKEDTNDDGIAVLYASGEIVNGNSPDRISAENYKEIIQKLIEEEDIKAVVLRVNSPGGSANASDEILFELEKLNASKPVVVSFGDVAASGGYYIAMAGRKIYAQPNTITGSIGVLGMLPSAEKMINNIGITTDYVKTNANSELYSPFTHLSEGTKHALVQGVETTYNRFLELVSKNRNKSVAEIDSIAQGRVWSGTRALEIGLVDELGGLNEAISHAAELANLEEYEIHSYPKAEDEMQQLLRKLESFPFSESYLESQLSEEELKLFEEIKKLRNTKDIQMYTPFSLQF